MHMTSEAARSLKGKVVRFTPGAELFGLLFSEGMRARITNVKDSSKSWLRLFVRQQEPLFHLFFDFREFEDGNKAVARAAGEDSIWTAEDPDWLPKTKTYDVHLSESDNVFDVVEYL